ncbi:MAG: hypothetical protein DRP38_06370 [Thermotogae bacterium]|nr:MAG: hypothetical protein DRP38_06370 [Thermotogota bacterium]
MNPEIIAYDVLDSTDDFLEGIRCSVAKASLPILTEARGFSPRKCCIPRYKCWVFNFDFRI